MRSGELARLSKVSTDTLRHYERLSLLAEPKRTNGNYRDYPSTSRNRVELIQRALTIGFTLRELKPILAQRDHGAVPCHGVRVAFGCKIRRIGEQIRRLEAMREELRRISKEWDKRLRRAKSGQVAQLLETVAPRLERPPRIRRKGYQ